MTPRRISIPLTDNQKIAVCPIPDAKVQARVDGNLDNELMARYIVAAYDFLSGPDGWLGGACLLEEEWEWLPGTRIQRRFELPLRPLRGTPTFEWWQGATTYAAVDPATYYVTTRDLEFSYIDRLLTSVTWPYTDLADPRAYRLTFKAGFAAVNNPMAVPSPIRLSIAMLASHWYNNRETVGTEGREPGKEIMYGLKSLAGRYRFGPDHS